MKYSCFEYSIDKKIAHISDISALDFVLNVKQDYKKYINL